MIDPNHDIVPTLRMFDGLMMNKAADEIEHLRNVQMSVDLNIRRMRAFYFRHNPPNTALAVIFNGLLKANESDKISPEEHTKREDAAKVGLHPATYLHGEGEDE